MLNRARKAQSQYAKNGLCSIHGVNVSFSPRDAGSRPGSFEICMTNAERQARYLVKSNRVSCFQFFEKAVNAFPNHTVIWTPDQSYTSQEAFKRVCQFSAFFLEKNVQPGEVVALYLLNAPEFMFAWLALWAIVCEFSTYSVSRQLQAHTVKRDVRRL